MTDPLTKYWKLHKYAIVMAIASLALYQTFAYHLERTDFIKLVTLFAALFFFCLKLIQFEKWNLKFLVAVGILFRLVFLFALPNLSQDFYRFIWDGQQVAHGINPYLFTPEAGFDNGLGSLPNAQQLYLGMGELSAVNFSNYPPLNQLIFSLATILGGKSILGSVIAMRIVIILADVGILYFGRRLLQKLNRSTHHMFWYFLNPLVIIELTGNLHFEGVMLFFFVWSLFLIVQGKWKSGAVVYALSIAVKLIPLMFLPLFLIYFDWKKSLTFYPLVGTSSMLLLLPFYSPQFLAHYSQTIELWFINFEFNAGLFNAIKKIALQFDVPGYKLIKSYGKVMPFLVVLIVLLLTFLRKNQKFSTLIHSMMWILLSYYLLATTVHPWYVIFLLLLSVFTPYRFPIIWSLVVVLSYFAYGNPDFKENLGLLLVEYIAVYGFMIYELFKLSKLEFRFFKN
ncbi:mannosyltransferase [Flavobacteriaceae bacterium F89]|uniref:Mannosyltransferase n=1 Tax=Cerina litoralis TaxID=2874477 RepID=A0AAE3EVW8_9FLAO|nr:mannosyltransferase [Cerina litoralis]MCG2460627.1 mannosyltransferase [Cerina litoralis]